MAISLLQDDFDCPYTFTKNYTQYCCDKCYTAFKAMNFASDPNVCKKHKNLINQNEKRANSLCALIKYCKNDHLLFLVTFFFGTNMNAPKNVAFRFNLS